MTAPSHVTLAQVARACDVSTSTASAALSGTGRVSTSTALRVRATAAALGYRINPAAQSMRAGRAPHVGLVLDVESIALDSDDHPALWWPRACLSMLHELGQHGVLMTLLSSDVLTLDNPVPLDALVTVERPDGSAALPAWLPFGTPVLLGGDIGVNAVTDSRAPDRPASIRRAAPSYGRAETMVLDHLWQVGARRPALLTAPSRLSPGAHTESAYRRWCARHGVEPIVVGRSGGSIDRRVAEALDLGADAIHSEIPSAAEVLVAISSRARVPRDVKLVVTGEGLVEQHLDPPVTTLSFLGAESGRRVAREVLRALRTGELRDVRIPTRLTPRPSTTG